MGRFKRASTIRIRAYVTSAMKRLREENHVMARPITNRELAWSNIYNTKLYDRRSVYRMIQRDTSRKYLILYNHAFLKNKEDEVLRLAGFNKWEPTMDQVAHVEWLLGHYCKQKSGLYWQTTLPRDLIRLISAYVTQINISVELGPRII